MFTMFGYGRCVGWEYKEEVTTTWPRQEQWTPGARPAQRIKTTYLKHKTLHNPIVMEHWEQGLAKTSGAAEEARADEESGTEQESDGAPDSSSGSALGSFRKRPNPWNLVFDKFGSGKTDDAINALRKSRDTVFNATARENGVLDYPFCFLALQSRGKH